MGARRVGASVGHVSNPWVAESGRPTNWTPSTSAPPCDVGSATACRAPIRVSI